MGRVKGSWDLTTPEKITQFREEHRISRARFAASLGVSSTSVQNWETGIAIATRKTQAKIVEVMANPSIVPGSLRGPSLFDRPGAHGYHAQTCEATGKIVNAWIATHPDMKPDDVSAIIRAVKGALS